MVFFLGVGAPRPSATGRRIEDIQQAPVRLETLRMRVALVQSFKTWIEEVIETPPEEFLKSDPTLVTEAIR